MKYPLPAELEQWRIRGGPYASDTSYGNNGAFIVPCVPHRSTLKLLMSDQEGWEHVSVSVHRQKRLPTWEEMCWVKELVWRPDERVVQYHPPEAEYVRAHPYVLHLWRPIDAKLPYPPYQMVGGLTVEENLRLAQEIMAR